MNQDEVVTPYDDSPFLVMRDELQADYESEAKALGMREPECKYGFPQSQLQEWLGGEKLARLNEWMYGQTMAICDGQEYDPDTKENKPSGCGPHGVVIYSWDVQRFLAGRPIID